MPQTLLARYIRTPCDYEPVWHAMQAFTARRNTGTPDELWLLQHTPVYTLGQAGDRAHILDTCDTPLVQSDRGGQVTWHGPGQLMVYTLLDTRRLKHGPKTLVNALEQAIINTLQPLGIKAEHKTDAPGVYIPIDAILHKIASVGLRLRQTGCYHGAALNLDCDLAPFKGINPCGHVGQPVTRLADLATSPWTTERLGQALAKTLAQQLGYDSIEFNCTDNFGP